MRHGEVVEVGQKVGEWIIERIDVALVEERPFGIMFARQKGHVSEKVLYRSGFDVQLSVVENFLRKAQPDIVVSKAVWNTRA